MTDRVLDEQALRRPDFDPSGRAVTLCDGQTWTFPVPAVRCLYPSRGPDGVTKLVEGYDRGAEYDRLTDVYTESDDYFTRVAALTDLAFLLLSANYALEFADVRHLLFLESGDRAEANAGVWAAVSAVALGRAPKATAVGAEPA